MIIGNPFPSRIKVGDQEFIFKGCLRFLSRAALLVNRCEVIILADGPSGVVISKWEFQGRIAHTGIVLTDILDHENRAQKACLNRLDEHKASFPVPTIPDQQQFKKAIFSFHFDEQNLLDKNKFGFQVMSSKLILKRIIE